MLGVEQDTPAEYPGWDSMLPAVVYNLCIAHKFDGSFSIWIKEVGDTPDDRRSIADTLRRAANWIDPDFIEPDANTQA